MIYTTAHTVIPVGKPVEADTGAGCASDTVGIAE